MYKDKDGFEYVDLFGDKSGIKIIDFKSFQVDEKRLELEDKKSIEE